MSARHIMLMLAGFLSGCASSTLQLQVDLYNGDPRVVVPLLPDEAAALVGDIERLRGAAREKTALRENLASTGVDYYLATWEEVAGKKSTRRADLDRELQDYIGSAEKVERKLEDTLDASLVKIAQYRDDYVREYENAKAAFDACEQTRTTDLDTAKKRIDIETIEPECRPPEKGVTLKRQGEEWIWRRMPASLRESEARAREAVDTAVAAYRGFAGPVSDSFVIDWPGLRGLLAKSLEAAQSAGLGAEESRLKIANFNLDLRVAAYAEHTRQVSGQSIDATKGVTGRRFNSGMFDSVLAVAAELEGLRSTPPETESARVAFANLVRNGAVLSELIDRVQDTGDPVLRYVSSPENAGNWNLEHSKTYFYAQGKSSVVIVRDNAGRYTLHEANNNPAGLIKGQLEISRAVANAAMTIASAQSGLKIPRKTAAEGGGATDIDVAAGEALAKRKAVAAVIDQNYTKAISALQLQLGSVLSSIANANGNAATLASQKIRLQAILKAYRSTFATPGS